MVLEWQPKNNSRPVFRDPENFKYIFYRAKFGNAELKQIGPYECCEKKPVFAVEKRAYLNPESEAQQDEYSCYCMNPVGNDYGGYLRLFVSRPLVYIICCERFLLIIRTKELTHFLD